MVAVSNPKHSKDFESHIGRGPVWSRSSTTLLRNKKKKLDQCKATDNAIEKIRKAKGCKGTIPSLTPAGHRSFLIFSVFHRVSPSHPVFCRPLSGWPSPSGDLRLVLKLALKSLKSLKPKVTKDCFSTKRQHCPLPSTHPLSLFFHFPDVVCTWQDRSGSVEMMTGV